MLPRLLLLILAGCALPAEARAHFLFIHIGPPAEGGRAAEVFFSEYADVGDPKFIGKVAATQLWLQTTPGEFQPLKAHQGPDRLRALVPPSGSMAVHGSLQYGVLARPKQTAFLLKHYPKAVAGNPDEVNRLKPYPKVPLEITATFASGGMTFTALREGKPLPKVAFTTVDARLANEKLTADEQGQAAWKPPAPGRYCVYIPFTYKAAGEVDGKKYEEVREFATLAFDWPLVRKDADALAVALFQEAIAARSSWQDFPGFNAAVRGNLDGRPFAGTVAVDAKGEVSVDTGMEEAAQLWVQEQLESIVLHRIARPVSADAPKPILRFADTRTDHPLGRLLVFEGGKFASSYRVKDKQIMVVNRYIGKQFMTITVLDNDKTADGKFLPRSYTVQYWDAATGALKKTETVQETWQRLDRWDLPATHTVSVASETGLSVRSFTLSKVELMKTK